MSFVEGTNDIPKLVDENGRVLELVETQSTRVTCYTEKPLRNGEKIDFTGEQWNKGTTDIFLTYKDPKGTSKLGPDTQKITLTGKSAYFILEIKDGKLKMIEKGSRKEQTLNVEQQPCWVCFRLKRSRIKMCSPTLRDRTTSAGSVEQSEGRDPVVTLRNSGSLERPTPTPTLSRSISLPIHVFAEKKIKEIDEKLDECSKRMDKVDAAVGQLKAEEEDLTRQLITNQVALNKQLATQHDIRWEIEELKYEKVETQRCLKK